MGHNRLLVGKISKLGKWKIAAELLTAGGNTTPSVVGAVVKQSLTSKQEEHKLKALLHRSFLVAFAFTLLALPGTAAEKSLQEINSELNEREAELADPKYSYIRDLNRSRVASTLKDRARFYEQQGKMELAEADLNRAVQLHETYCSCRAELYEKLGKFELANADWNRSIELEPTALHLNQRAEFYENRESYELADADWIRALQAVKPGEKYFDSKYISEKRADYYLRRLDKKANKGGVSDEDLNAAVQINPEKFLKLRAGRYEITGRLELAEADLSRGVLLKPEDYLEERAEFYERAGKLQLAEQDWNRYSELKPSNCLRVGFYERLGKFELAENELNRIVKLDPTYTIGVRADFYQRMGKMQQAEADWNRAVQINPDKPKLSLSGRALFYEEQGKNDLAEADWNRCIEIHKSWLSRRAQFHERQGKLRQAEDDWNKAVDFQPDAFLLDRAKFFERQGKFELAEADWRGCKTNQLNQRALFYERIGKNELAEADWNQCVQLKYPNSLMGRARFFERQGKLEIALRDIDEAINSRAISNNVFDVKHCKVRILAGLGKRELAEATARELLGTTHQAAGWSAYGMARTKAELNLVLGDYKQALSDLQLTKFEKEIKDDHTAQLILGAVYEGLGDKTAACNAFKRCLEICTAPQTQLGIEDALDAQCARGRLAALGGSSPVKQIALAKDIKTTPLALIRLSKIRPLSESASNRTTSPTTTQTSAASSSSLDQSANHPIRDKWALVIGISNFANKNYNLRFAAKDARDFYSFLTKEAGFRDDHVLLMIDQKATQRNIMDAFGDNFLPTVTEPGDLVVIFVSTHGTPSRKDKGGRNYIVAYDTDVNKLYSTGVDMDELYRRIKEGVKTDRALIVMDTCYSGAGVPGSKSLNSFDNFDAESVAQGCGHRVITSSSPNERSWESKTSQNGVFTKHLLGILRSNNNRIDVKMAFEQLQEKVSWEVKSAFGEKQTPQLGGEWSGNELILSLPATRSRSIMNPDLLKFMKDCALVSVPQKSGNTSSPALLIQKAVSGKKAK